MRRIYACDERIQQLLSAGAMQFQYYPCGGQEAIPATLVETMNDDDFMVTTYRCVHDIIAKGSAMSEVIGEMAGRSSGTSKGKGGPMHLADPGRGLMVSTGIVGGGLPIANGIALAAQLNGTGRVVAVSFGDGAANIGAFNESLNLASLWKLPVVFVCQNNQYAEYTSYADSTRVARISERAAGYAMPGITVDGTDPAALYGAAKDAVARARAGDGPTLLECVAHRLQGHAFGSETEHMDQQALAKHRAAPPLERLRSALLERGYATGQQLDTIDAEALAEVEDALAEAMAADEPGADEFYRDVFADGADVPYRSDAAARRPMPDLADRPVATMTMAQAIADALDIALSDDPSVFLLGEDIVDPAGGVTKATVGLSTKHGTERVRATPISEQAIVGAAIGASLCGTRPVAEIMINDFTMVCMDQIANHAAKLRYMSGGRTPVPITIRSVTAGNVGSFGAQHSQSLEAYFTHTPGIKVAMPSTAHDAKGLLLAAIEDPDPVLVIEPMRLYYSAAEVPEGRYTVPFGQAAVRRSGTDVTIIAYGWAAAEADDAAKMLARDGIEAELIDLRTLVPLDFETCVESVTKTGRCVITHAAVEFSGFGAELSAKLAEVLHGRLAAPIKRVGARYTPIAFAGNLEAMHFPNAQRIADTAASLVDRSKQSASW
ncbi:MAG: dehydrogenase E1 component subunit alpha/beta [Pseudomonadota bacterium]